MIRVVVAEDSATARALIVAILSADPEIEVVGQAEDGEQVVELARLLRPDLITMDVHMPRASGFEATRRILAERPVAIIVISGTVDVRDVRSSLDVLDAGALALLPKPAGPLAPTFAEDARRLVTTVKAMARIRLVPRAGRPSRITPVQVATRTAPIATPRIVALCASTGGPAALHRLLPRLSGMPVPLLIVQHMAIGFTNGFAEWLASVSPMPVRLAVDGETLQPGTVYLADDDRHLGVSRGAIALSSSAAIGGFRPSGNHLFESVAHSFGAAAVGVMLTGMGRDGVEGLRALHDAGAHVIAQDEATSVVYGMPKEAVAVGAVDEVVALDAIAGRLQALATRGD